SGLLLARVDAVNHRVTNAAALRAAGKIDEAREELQRAKALDPQNGRIAALLTELDTEQRQLAALTDAESWLAKKRPDVAQRIVAQALKDNPRHAGLIA